MAGSLLSHLECEACRGQWPADRIQSTCPSCGGPLLAKYRLDDPQVPSLREVLDRPRGQFRFTELLPQSGEARTLGEGGTPLLRAEALGPSVWVKDEAQNPTGSFKARGMAVAVAKNVELGATRFTVPSNGNAGLAAAAYGALYGVSVTIAVPADTPRPLVEMPRLLGAEVIEIDGTIADAARSLDAMGDAWFSLATLREPYRVEGKKMMGYEIFWDLGRLPDVVFYPTGGGTGLVGMVKAWEEMEALGWTEGQRPRMVAVQVDGCAPIVRAFHQGEPVAGTWSDPAASAAFGLRVPSAIGDRLMLAALRKTDGTAVAVGEEEMLEATERLAAETGILGSPEGGACLAAYQRLLTTHHLSKDDEVVLFNTGAASNYWG